MATGMTNATGGGVKTVLQVYTKANVTVTATDGSKTKTTTSNSAGLATMTGLSIGTTYTVTANNKSKSVLIEGLLTTVDLTGFVFSMTFNATTFKTDPTGCLAYGDDCAGFTPVSGPGSSLAKCSTIGSWVMNADGTSTNPLLEKCFYATFTSNGVPHEKLNPQNLAQKIATWNGSEWVSASGSSSITTENTMFCIPTIYLDTSASSIKLSSDPSGGTAFAHTIGGHTYNYLAIGVYEGYNNSSKLMSLSGKASSASITRATFRTYAKANTVQNGHAMLWNFHQWNLWRIMTIFAMKSFNGQTRIGQGGFTYNGSTGQGLCNALGPFAGSTSTSASTSTSVKAFIENPWGYKYEFIDDFYGTGGTYYIGQNATPTDDANNKPFSTSDFKCQGTSANEIITNPEFWGLGKNTSGSSSQGLCDYQYYSTSSDRLGPVGGYSDSVSGGHAGPSYLHANHDLSYSSDNLGARLAFVFDL